MTRTRISGGLDHVTPESVRRKTSLHKSGGGANDAETAGNSKNQVQIIGKLHATSQAVLPVPLFY